MKTLSRRIILAVVLSVPAVCGGCAPPAGDTSQDEDRVYTEDQRRQEDALRQEAFNRNEDEGT